MPTYEYVCEKCGHQFDLFQSMKDKPLQVCPEELCGRKRWGKGRVRRVPGAGAGLIFKGSGFYITDYRSDSYKEAAKKEKPASTPPATGSGGDGKPSPAKPESKPAPAPKTKK
jgi:putative FmdB family regulatory protein